MVDLEKLQQLIDYQADEASLLETAMYHKSYVKEQGIGQHNEKLEFLGDAVLDLVLADLLMTKFTDDQEGNLSRKRASIVNEERLCELALQRNLDQFIQLGKSEIKNELQKNPRLLASAFEAIIGAIYQDKGYGVVFTWIEKTFAPLLDEAFFEHDFEKDYKTRFQEKIQEIHKVTPVYRVTGQTGPDHQKNYLMEVSVDGEVWAEGQGASKKMAAQDAAKNAMEKLPK